MTKVARRGTENLDAKTLPHTNPGAERGLARWAEFERGRKETKREEGETEERRDRELDWGRGDLE